YTAVKVFFFFQAEDGIRDFHVTGVQTCALPIYPDRRAPVRRRRTRTAGSDAGRPAQRRGRRRESGPRAAAGSRATWRPRRGRRRSEERRVGKEGRLRLSPGHEHVDVSSGVGTLT